MTITEAIALFGIMVALAAMPSSSVALVVVRAATLGVVNGVAAALGIVLGDLVFILLAISGLSVIAEAMGGFFLVIKCLAAVYLLWMGVVLLTSSEKVIVSMTPPPDSQKNLATSFVAGFFLTLGDIKAIFFYVSLFPVFVDMAALRVLDILAIISVMIVGVGGMKICYALFAVQVVAMARRHALERAVRKTAGGLMVGAGGYLIIKA